MSAAEQDFEQKLRTAAQLLARAEADDAEQAALQALRQRPGNPLAQNLVGLSYLQQQRYEQALEVFDALARRNADVVTLRVNAGVAALLAGDRGRAESHLRRAVDLDAGHRRAFAFLALTHHQGGQCDLAGAALVEAGLTDLAERLREEGDGTELGEAIRRAAYRLAPGSGVSPSPAPWEGFAEVGSLAVADEPITAGGAPDGTGGAADARAEAPAGDGEIDGSNIDEALSAAFDQFDVPQSAAEAPPPAVEPVVQAPQQEELADAEADRGGRATRQRLLAIRPPATTCLEVFPKLPSGARLTDVARHNAAEEDDRRCLVVGEEAMAAGVYLRADLIALARGELTATAAPRREKGGVVGPLQVDERPLVRLVGRGSAVLVVGPDDCIEALRLVDEACYVVDWALAGFAAGLHFEHGCIPGTAIGAVELAGRGFVGLRCRAPLERVGIAPGRPLLVRGDCLVCWGGDVVPCVSGTLSAAAPHVELSGKGVAVLCLAGGPSAAADREVG